MPHKLKKYFKIILKIILVFVLVGYFSGFFLVTTTYQVTSSKLPASFDGYTIVQLSDYHSSNLFHNRILERINKIDPDIVVMTGDMITDQTEDFQDFIALAGEISGNYPVYYVVGNHEQELSPNQDTSSDSSRKLQKLLDSLSAEGVHILNNESVTLTRDGEKINLYGLWIDLSFYHRQADNTMASLSAAQVQESLGAPGDRFTILLTHNPRFFSAYCKWGADLTLTGHIHGGIIRLPFVGGLLSPNFIFFPKYDSGVFQKGNQEMIVNRGIGSGSIIPRFYDCPEVVKIVLHKK